MQTAATISMGGTHARQTLGAQEASFCIIRGQTANGKRPLLERIAGELLMATEALAVQERDYRSPDGESFRAYLSVIVTTAPLYVADFDPSAISLVDGTLPALVGSKQVPYVRFRKQLVWDAAKPIRPTGKSPAIIASARENSVFVVNANGLLEFLEELELDAGSVLQYMSK